MLFTYLNVLFYLLGIIEKNVQLCEKKRQHDLENSGKNDFGEKNILTNNWPFDVIHVRRKISSASLQFEHLA